MEQVRGRVRLLALLLLVAFSFDPLIYFGMWAVATIAGYPVVLAQLGFRLLDVGAVAASGALWWVARSRAVSADRIRRRHDRQPAPSSPSPRRSTSWYSRAWRKIPSNGHNRRESWRDGWGRSTGQENGTRNGLANGGPSISRPGPELKKVEIHSYEKAGLLCNP